MEEVVSWSSNETLTQSVWEEQKGCEMFLDNLKARDEYEIDECLDVVTHVLS